MKYTVTGKILTMHRTMEVTDENDTLLYTSTSKAVSITDKSRIEDVNGRRIASFHKKVISIHGIHYIEMADGAKMTMKTELFHPFRSVIDVEENGWKIKGKFTSHEYVIVDSDGRELAEVRRPWVTVHDKCELDIKDAEHKEEILALTIALEHMLIDNRVAAETASADAGTAAAGAAEPAD